MTSSPDNTIENILDDLCKNTQVDYGYEKLVPSETIKAKQSLDSHYLSIFLELVGADEQAPPVTQKVIDGVTVYDQFDDLLRPGKNALRQELRTALQDRLGEK